MGEIRNHCTGWRKRRDSRRKEAKPFKSVTMEKPKDSPSAEKVPKIRYSNDGFWTTQHPATTAFSIEWFKTHLVVLPYCWEMLKMSLTVSRWSCLIITFGTLARALVDVAQLYAYTRFVNEVRLVVWTAHSLRERLKIRLFTRFTTWKSYAFSHC